MNSNARISIGIAAAFVLVAGILLAVNAGNRAGSANSANSSTSSGTASDTDRHERLVRPDSHRLDVVADGKATFVEFLDFECESCRAAFPVVEQLRKKYAGKVTFVVRYFPLPGHFNAERAARAVEAAAQQGKFEQMYRKMYETQAAWGEQQLPADDRFRGFAKELGLDLAAFDRPTTPRPPSSGSNATSPTAKRSASPGRRPSSSTAPSCSPGRPKTSPRASMPHSTSRSAVMIASPPADRSTPFPRLLPWLLLIGGAIGLAAAGVLTVEKIALLRDPAYVPSCSINPILSCGSVMTKPQAEVFGFPNPLLGIAGFAIVTTIGAALLAGATFRRWFWLGLQGGVTFGLVFVHWLIFQSLYRIQALCPYCMVVWAVTVPIFWYITLHNLNRGHLPSPASTRSLVLAATRFHSVALTIWAVVLLTLIGEQFWAYWRTLP